MWLHACMHPSNSVTQFHEAMAYVVAIMQPYYLLDSRLADQAVP